MSCAACDDCPQDAWHLHVTVRPHWSWHLNDVASAIQRDIERHNIRPVVVTNVFRDSKREPYKELIPTKHFVGNEAEASREIFRMGVLLNNAGWRVKRLKIEGNPEGIRDGRALYFESHIKVPDGATPPVLPLSRTATSLVATVRRGSYVETINDTLFARIDLGLPFTDPVRIEAAVLDTNPGLDEEWINEVFNANEIQFSAVGKP